MSSKTREQVGESSVVPRHPGINWWPFTLFLLLAMILWILFWVAMVRVIPDWQTHPQFDMFSAANALFSAFAFGGLIYTIILQRRDLAFQLEELRQTRDELRGQREQLEAQNTTFRRQSFEIRFFEWIKLHHEIVNAIEHQSAIGNVGFAGHRKGRECFMLFVGELNALSSQVLQQASPEHLRQIQPGETLQVYRRRLYDQSAMSKNDIALEAYDALFSSVQGKVGHYFRNLYNLVKFVDRSELSDREKRFYTNIVRAQLSSYELTLLFYNCLAPQGAKFKPLAEKYGLLKNMDRSLLLHADDAGSYASGAFQGEPSSYPDGS